MVILGGAWGQTAPEISSDSFEMAIYGTIHRRDETHDNYISRHEGHVEQLRVQGVILGQMWAYVLPRQSQLSAGDRQRIVIEQAGKLEYTVVPAIHFLGSKVFTDRQGQRGGTRKKVHDANETEESEGR